MAIEADSIESLIIAINRNTAALLTVAAFTAKASGGTPLPASTTGIVVDSFGKFEQLVAKLYSDS